MTQPRLAQPLFASEDYGLLHDLLSDYLGKDCIRDGARHAKLTKLRYRLGHMLPTQATIPYGAENNRNPLVWE